MPNQNNTCVPRFDEAIATAEQRLATLQKQAAGASEDQRYILSAACQELQITLDELQVADEELRQQNEELVTARQVAEVERQRYQALFDFAPAAYKVWRSCSDGTYPPARNRRTAGVRSGVVTGG